MNYSEACKYSTRLISKLESLDSRNLLDFALISKAIYWARKYHGSQLRKSGEPFYTHPLEVAYMVSDYSLKTDVIVASILHDIVEDTEVTVVMICDNFGWRIAEMVDRLTRDKPDGTKLSVEEILNNAYQLEDKEVLLIKCVDRLHNMQTISSMNSETQIKTSIQTLDTLLFYSLYLNNLELECQLTSFATKILKRRYHNNSLTFEINELFIKSPLSPLPFQEL